MEEKDESLLSCPWLQDSSISAYASDAVVRFLVGENGFSSPKIRNLFRARGGFTFKAPEYIENQDGTDESKLIGSILHKISCVIG
jgi:hypothetical protein